MSDIDPIETARELATHANDIEHLQADMDKMVIEMKEIKDAIVSIQKTLSEAKGGWRVMVGVGSAFASSTININENKGIDIGQGVSLVTTCDDQIVVSAKSSIDKNAWDTNTASSKPYFKLSGLFSGGLKILSNSYFFKI